MNNTRIIQAWLDPEYRETLGADAPAHPAGIVELNDAEISSFVGGAEAPTVCSGGIFSTLFGSRKQTCCPKWKKVVAGDSETASNV